MAKKQKKMMVAQVIVPDGRAVNPRINGDIMRWQKAAEMRGKRDREFKNKVFSELLDGFRLRKINLHPCHRCKRKFETVAGLRTHTKMVHSEMTTTS